MGGFRAVARLMTALILRLLGFFALPPPPRHVDHEVRGAHRESGRHRDIPRGRADARRDDPQVAALRRDQEPPVGSEGKRGGGADGRDQVVAETCREARGTRPTNVTASPLAAGSADLR